MNECFFCGQTERPLTEEHVWPVWISKLLRGKYGSDHFVHIRSTGNDTTGLWKAPVLKVTTNTVCDECNNDWLSAFENDVIKPIASPLILGEPVDIITPADQEKLAAWAYKMALLLEVAMPQKEREREFFTAAERLDFRKTTFPNEHVRVFLANFKYGQEPAHALYRAIDQPHSRYRRPVPARQVVDRLMRLDTIVLQPELIWLATDEEKVALFSLMAPSFPRERLPHLVVGQGTGRRLRLFPDDQPVGVATTGRVVFTCLVTAWETAALRAFVQRHADLLRGLPGWTLRLVLPQQLADTRARFEGVVRDELTPLRPELLAELKWYFAKRRSTPNPRALSFEDPEFWEHQAAFSSPRFQQLYWRWLTDGDTIFEALASSSIIKALERGTGRIESHVLLPSYRHLAPLVSLFRSCRKGVEGGETSSAPSQPPRSPSPSASADSMGC